MRIGCEISPDAHSMHIGFQCEKAFRGESLVQIEIQIGVFAHTEVNPDLKPG